jgi:GT2 family glycosyltransferase
MKKLLIEKILANPVIGRPMRKFFWLLIRFVQNLEIFLAEFYAQIPYVKSLSLAAKNNPATATVLYYKQLKDRLTEVPYRPLVSILLPVHHANVHHLDECLKSVAFQIYDHWELCFVCDRSLDAATDDVIKSFSKKHPTKTKYKLTQTDELDAKALNDCVQMSRGEYIAILGHSDRLLPNALAEMVRHINKHSKPDILYSDERVIASNGENTAKPYFKPSWSKFMHLSVDFTAHLAIYSRAIFENVGGFRTGFEGAHNYDLMLRAVEATKKPITHVPFVLYQRRENSSITRDASPEKVSATTNGTRAVKEALNRRGHPGQVLYDPEKSRNRVKIHLMNTGSLVSIIIPSKDNVEYLELCVSSIFSKSTFQNFEVIVVDNGSKSGKTLSYYRDAKAKYGNRFVFDIVDHPFNFGHQVNRGAKLARGDYFLLLNDDTEVITPDWIEEMMQYAQLDEVGSVGCKLLYRNMTVQNAGIVLIGADVATSISGRQDNDPHYHNILQTLHEVSAVSAACLMTKKKTFWEVQGFNDFEVANGFGDVDFCLKIREKNYLNIYTPYARVFHTESASRGVSFEVFEMLYMRRHWGHLLLNDPYLNFNFKLDNDFRHGRDAECQDINGKLMQVFLNQPFEDWLGYTSL